MHLTILLGYGIKLYSELEETSTCLLVLEPQKQGHFSVLVKIEEQSVVTDHF